MTAQGNSALDDDDVIDQLVARRRLGCRTCSLLDHFPELTKTTATEVFPSDEFGTISSTFDDHHIIVRGLPEDWTFRDEMRWFVWATIVKSRSFL